MNGYTIQELSQKLGISEHAVYIRLNKAGIKPLTQQAIYPETALETIREVSKGGRPRKTPPPADKRDENRPERPLTGTPG